MKDASQYPITTPYGIVQGYPLNNGFHQGIDYGCPTGTPVVVNGVTIGLSGATGFVSGPHLHVGKFINGVVQNPIGGFNFNDAIVTEIHNTDDSNNGKYVRVQGDGASWVYLHLSQINASKGQVLKGEDMSDVADFNFVNDAAVGTLGREAVGDQNLLNNVGRPKSDVLREFVNYPEAKAFRNKASNYDKDVAAAANATVLQPGTYKVN